MTLKTNQTFNIFGFFFLISEVTYYYLQILFELIYAFTCKPPPLLKALECAQIAIIQLFWIVLPETSSLYNFQQYCFMLWVFPDHHDGYKLLKNF